MMLTGAAISAALGAVVSYRLYKKAGDDLRKKAAKLGFTLTTPDSLQNTA